MTIGPIGAITGGVRPAYAGAAQCQWRQIPSSSMRRDHLSRAQARRIALAAQGFGRPRPDRPVSMRDVQATISRLGQFQIDSINVVTRAHFMPLFSRLGSYDPGLLERAAHRPPRRLFEYWGHAASLIDVDLQPLLRFRMRAGFRDVWSGVERVARENPGLVDFVREEVAGQGSGQRPRPGDRGGPRPQQLGLELVERQDGAGVAVLLRRGDLGVPQQPVRAGLRHARAGAAGGGPGGADPGSGRVGDRAGPAGGPRAGRGQRVLPARLLPHPAGDDPGRRSPPWWRPAN